MTGGIKNFKGKEKVGWFHVNPQNINNKWRPKKWLGLLNDQLKEKGYKAVTNQEVQETYMQLFNLTLKELENIWNDKKQPWAIRILISNLLNKKKGWDVIERMLDRWVWKSTQRQEISGANWGPITILDAINTEKVKQRKEFPDE